MRAPLGFTLATLLLLSAIVSAAPAGAQDTDGDGVPDAADNCLTRANASQHDTPDFFVGRNDGFGNACDADWNDNGIVNHQDFQMLKQHYLHGNQDEFDEEISVDGSGFVGGATLTLLKQQYFGLPGPSGLGTDADTDGWVEPGFDNCPTVHNPDQADADDDGTGDLCENLPPPDDFEQVASGAGRMDDLLVDPSGNVHVLYASADATGVQIIRWLREQLGGWVTTTPYTSSVNAGDIRTFATDMKSGGQLCAYWNEGGTHNFYGCIDETGVMQAELLPESITDIGGVSALAHDRDGRPHIVTYMHGVVDGLDHYLGHTRFTGSGWTPRVNLPSLPGPGNPETGNYDVDIVVDGVSGAVHVVHFYYHASTLLLDCDDRGDLAVSTWDLATGDPEKGFFRPLHIAVQGVDPGLLGKSMWDVDAWLGADGQIHAVYRVGVAVGGSCENYDPIERVFYATGDPLAGTWPVTLLEDRPAPNPNVGLQISNLVRDGNGTLHVASHAADDPQNIHLLSISGGGVSEQAIQLDGGGILHLRAAPRAAAQEPMILINQASTWRVREPPAP